MYADDTVLVAPSPSGLQRLINICDIYASMCDIIFNVKKSKYMCVRPKHFRKLNIPKMYLNGNSLELVHKYKYLGHMMCSDNSDDDAIYSQTRALYARGNAIVKHFKHCSEEVKILLFKTFCSFVLLSFMVDLLWSFQR